MPRPIWSGHISFGLVTIPVTLYSAQHRSDLSFNLIDSRNNKRVRYERVNEETGEEVPWGEIVKGFEFSEGNYVLLSDEDFKRAKVEATKTVEIEDFVKAEEIDNMFFDRPYYLVPGKAGQKGYVLLREALKESGKVGIARVVIHSREYIGIVEPLKHALVLILMRFYQELRPAAEFDLPKGEMKQYKISAKEMTMAGQLIESMTSKWDPKRYHDEYRESLMAWIHKKAKSGKVAAIDAPEDKQEEKGGKIIDIMSLLKKSVEKQKSKKKPAKVS